MPHSSGGGSHGGGSHSGGGGHHSSSSHRSGGGSSSGSSVDFSNTRLSRRPYRNCATYCYYKNNRPVYVYSSHDAKGRSVKASDIAYKIVLFIMLAPAFLTFSWGMWFVGITKTEKIHYKDNQKIIIEDHAGVIDQSEKKELRRALKDFYDETGIIPAVVTLNNEEWQDRNDGKVKFTDVAYDEYVRRFKDEYHWLIVYSEPEDPDPEFNDWYWEGMQGDYTDPVLTVKKTDSFTEDLHKNFLDKKIGVGKAITMSFKKFTPVVMKSEIRWGVLVMSLLSSAGFVWFTIYVFDIHPIRKAILKKSFKCNKGKPVEETCDFCGGVYLIGYHLSCPYCGATIKAHSYTTDSEGRVQQVIS
ncbi:hypothetical protein SAMN02910456_00454 [Ruminococcaceae bacterium YRB3002]|nr:hypothetical protein SAMN02910456_00454 [Ruminococcaceae bacterium YRB3002]